MPRVLGKVSAAVSLGCSGHALLRLAQPGAQLLALESVHWLLSQGQDETGCGRVTRRGNMVPVGLGVDQRNTFAMMKVQIPKVILRQKKRSFSLSTDFPSYTRPVHVDQLSLDALGWSPRAQLQ